MLDDLLLRIRSVGPVLSVSEERSRIGLLAEIRDAVTTCEISVEVADEIVAFLFRHFYIRFQPLWGSTVSALCQMSSYSESVLTTGLNVLSGAFDSKGFKLSLGDSSVDVDDVSEDDLKYWTLRVLAWAISTKRSLAAEWLSLCGKTLSVSQRMIEDVVQAGSLQKSKLRWMNEALAVLLSAPKECASLTGGRLSVPMLEALLRFHEVSENSARLYMDRYPELFAPNLKAACLNLCRFDQIKASASKSGQFGPFSNLSMSHVLKEFANLAPDSADSVVLPLVIRLIHGRIRFAKGSSDEVKAVYECLTTVTSPESTRVVLLLIGVVELTNDVESPPSEAKQPVSMLSVIRNVYDFVRIGKFSVSHCIHQLLACCVRVARHLSGSLPWANAEAAIHAKQVKACYSLLGKCFIQLLELNAAAVCSALLTMGDQLVARACAALPKSNAWVRCCLSDAFLTPANVSQWHAQVLLPFAAQVQGAMDNKVGGSLAQPLMVLLCSIHESSTESDLSSTSVARGVLVALYRLVMQCICASPSSAFQRVGVEGPLEGLSVLCVLEQLHEQVRLVSLEDQVTQKAIMAVCEHFLRKMKTARSKKSTAEQSRQVFALLAFASASAKDLSLAQTQQLSELALEQAAGSLSYDDHCTLLNRSLELVGAPVLAVDSGSSVSRLRHLQKESDSTRSEVSSVVQINWDRVESNLESLQKSGRSLSDYILVHVVWLVRINSCPYNVRSAISRICDSSASVAVESLSMAQSVRKTVMKHVVASFNVMSSSQSKSPVVMRNVLAVMRASAVGAYLDEFYPVSELQGVHEAAVDLFGVKKSSRASAIERIASCLSSMVSKNALAIGHGILLTCGILQPELESSSVDSALYEASLKGLVSYYSASEAGASVQFVCSLVSKLMPRHLNRRAGLLRLAGEILSHLAGNSVTGTSTLSKLEGLQTDMVITLKRALDSASQSDQAAKSAEATVNLLPSSLWHQVVKVIMEVRRLTKSKRVETHRASPAADRTIAESGKSPEMSLLESGKNPERSLLEPGKSLKGMDDIWQMIEGLTGCLCARGSLDTRRMARKCLSTIVVALKRQSRDASQWVCDLSRICMSILQRLHREGRHLEVAVSTAVDLMRACPEGISLECMSESARDTETDFSAGRPSLARDAQYSLSKLLQEVYLGSMKNWLHWCNASTSGVGSAGLSEHNNKFGTKSSKAGKLIGKGDSHESLVKAFGLWAPVLSYSAFSKIVSYILDLHKSGGVTMDASIVRKYLDRAGRVVDALAGHCALRTREREQLCLSWLCDDSNSHHNDSNSHENDSLKRKPVRGVADSAHALTQSQGENSVLLLPNTFGNRTTRATSAKQDVSQQHTKVHHIKALAALRMLGRANKSTTLVSATPSNSDTSEPHSLALWRLVPKCVGNSYPPQIQMAALSLLSEIFRSQARLAKTKPDADQISSAAKLSSPSMVSSPGNQLTSQDMNALVSESMGQMATLLKRFYRNRTGQAHYSVNVLASKGEKAGAAGFLPACSDFLLAIGALLSGEKATKGNSFAPSFNSASALVFYDAALEHCAALIDQPGNELMSLRLFKSLILPRRMSSESVTQYIESSVIEVLQKAESESVADLSSTILLTYVLKYPHSPEKSTKLILKVLTAATQISNETCSAVFSRSCQTLLDKLPPTVLEQVLPGALPLTLVSLSRGTAVESSSGFASYVFRKCAAMSRPTFVRFIETLESKFSRVCQSDELSDISWIGTIIVACGIVHRDPSLKLKSPGLVPQSLVQGILRTIDDRVSSLYSLKQAHVIPAIFEMLEAGTEASGPGASPLSSSPPAGTDFLRTITAPAAWGTLTQQAKLGCLAGMVSPCLTSFWRFVFPDGSSLLRNLLMRCLADESLEVASNVPTLVGFVRALKALRSQSTYPKTELEADVIWLCDFVRRVFLASPNEYFVRCAGSLKILAVLLEPLVTQPDESFGSSPVALAVVKLLVRFTTYKAPEGHIPPNANLRSVDSLDKYAALHNTDKFAVLQSTASDILDFVKSKQGSSSLDIFESLVSQTSKEHTQKKRKSADAAKRLAILDSKKYSAMKLAKRRRVSRDVV